MAVPPYIKPKLWTGKDLKGDWLFTKKIDGVRAFYSRKEQAVISRKGKPLYNLLDTFNAHFGDSADVEVFCVNWNTSVSMVRTHSGNPVPVGCLYSLYPLDARLLFTKRELVEVTALYGVVHGVWDGTTTVVDPSAEFVQAAFKYVFERGFEGLVLHNGERAWKVKNKEDYDVEVTDVVWGTGKHEGRLGAFVTSMGKVGTGFSDEQREEFVKRDMIGVTIEVEAMGLTATGKFRHPRLVRERFDK